MFRTGFSAGHPLHGSILGAIYSYGGVSLDSKQKSRKVSASALSTFLSCGLKYKFSYIDEGVPVPMDSPHLIYGSAFHKAVEKMHKSIFYGKLLSVKCLQDIFMNEWQLGIELNDVPVKWYKHTQEEEMSQAGLRSIDNYFKAHKNDKPPPLCLKWGKEEVPAVEVGFRVSLAPLIPGCEWDLSGIIDLIDHQEVDALHVVDHKTSSSKYTPFQIKTNLQLAIYSWAFRQLVNKGWFPDYKKGTREDKVVFNVVSKKKPEIYIHRRSINEATYNHLARILSIMIAQTERGEFLPDYGSACDAYGGCEFREQCMGYQLS